MMSFRPQQAQWFELLVVRDDLGVALDILARSARVELQSHGETREPILLPDYREMLDEFDGLKRRYDRFWPRPGANPEDERVEPHAMLEGGLRRVRAWRDTAAASVERLEREHQRLHDLTLLANLFREAGRNLPSLDGLAGAGPMLAVRLYQLPSQEWPTGLPSTVLTQRLDSADGVFLLAVGLEAAVVELGNELESARARQVAIPATLPASPRAADQAIRTELERTTAEISALSEALEHLHERHSLADAIADIEFVRWYINNVPQLASTENFAWITGWTTDSDEEALLRKLADAGIKGLMRITAPPPGFEPPLVLRNPRWLRQFEAFTRMLGIPAHGQADPTRIVAIASPLMFGYMFGDVGHGAVLLIIGAIFSRRYPALNLLIAGGAASIAFGFLFGSVFALEDVIEPIWLHPMDEPLTLFVVPLIGGAVLLLLGMFLDAIQAWWQQAWKTWWETGAGLVLCYLGLLGAFLDTRMLFFSLLGATWFVIGHGLVAGEHRIAAAGAGLVELLESMMQLFVNTVSFVRVGAFALAHAGLSMAVVGVAEVATTAFVYVLLLVVGNLLIIGLEGLVAAIQTTRLILFEFFARFMTAEGRPFIPLEPASNALSGAKGNPS
jgi:V/A-type H+-transporting ATPase subunit I